MFAFGFIRGSYFWISLGLMSGLIVKKSVKIKKVSIMIKKIFKIYLI